MPRVIFEHLSPSSATIHLPPFTIGFPDMLVTGAMADGGATKDRRERRFDIIHINSLAPAPKSFARFSNNSFTSLHRAAEPRLGGLLATALSFQAMSPSRRQAPTPFTSASSSTSRYRPSRGGDEAPPVARLLASLAISRVSCGSRIGRRGAEMQDNSRR